MAKYWLLLSLLISTTQCRDKHLAKSEIVKAYYKAYADSNFERLIPLITDSIIIAEGDYVTSYSLDSYYEQFKWDSVFQPTYEVIGLEDRNDQVIATVASSSIRYRFLDNDPLTCRFNISFKNDQISKIEVLECESADWNIWEARRDTLVNWIGIEHPELDGFVHDLTMQGAINYLMAMELYLSKNRDHK